MSLAGDHHVRRWPDLVDGRLKHLTSFANDLVRAAAGSTPPGFRLLHFLDDLATVFKRVINQNSQGVPLCIMS
jgi:hypothetical protein